MKTYLALAIALLLVVTTLNAQDKSIAFAEKHKDPAVAGIFSFIIPGAGHVYNGNYNMAWSYFLVQSGFTAGALGAYDLKQKYSALYCLGVALSFKTLDIYFAVSNAKKHNARLKANLGMTWIDKTPGLNFKIQF